MTTEWHTGQTPVCPIERNHEAIPRGDRLESDICWACDLVRTLYYIAIGTNDFPSWDAQEILDRDIEWRDE